MIIEIFFIYVLAEHNCKISSTGFWISVKSKLEIKAIWFFCCCVFMEKNMFSLQSKCVFPFPDIYVTAAHWHLWDGCGVHVIDTDVCICQIGDGISKIYLYAHFPLYAKMHWWMLKIMTKSWSVCIFLIPSIILQFCFIALAQANMLQFLLLLYFDVSIYLHLRLVWTCLLNLYIAFVWHVCTSFVCFFSSPEPLGSQMSL